MFLSLDESCHFVIVLGIFQRKPLVPDTANGHLAAKPSSDKDSKVDSACGSGSISKSVFQVKTEATKKSQKSEDTKNKNFQFPLAFPT